MPKAVAGNSPAATPSMPCAAWMPSAAAPRMRTKTRRTERPPRPHRYRKKVARMESGSGGEPFPDFIRATDGRERTPLRPASREIASIVRRHLEGEERLPHEIRPTTNSPHVGADRNARPDQLGRGVELVPADQRLHHALQSRPRPQQPPGADRSGVHH
ncbi:hypothetical protein D3C78_1336340 [compost metagenome]